MRAELTEPARIGELKLALMPRQERFTIEIGGQTTVFQWNDEIYELLRARRD